MTRIAEALASARKRLAVLPHAESELEATLLLSRALEKPRTHLLAWPDKPLMSGQTERYEALLQRRLAGEPIAHITGEREFWSLLLEVTPDTLIPRPETELLVELALERIPRNAAFRIADLGTGSGAIAAAIGYERPACHIHATDLSAAALVVARRNFERLGLKNIVTAQGSWCEALDPTAPFDLIVSNPPYIAEHDAHLTQGDLPREPRRALAAGADGLEAIRVIIADAPRHLVAGGILMLEHGFDQGPDVRRMLADAGFTGVATHRDLGGRERATLAVCPI